MVDHTHLLSTSTKETQDGSPILPEDATLRINEKESRQGNICSEQPLSPVDRVKSQTLSPVDADPHFNSFNKSSRTASIYSLSRLSLSSQLTQLTSLTLPDAATLSTSITIIPTAPAATTVISNAAEQINVWLTKAAEVLNGLDAEDDVEWAAAGGREGLAEVDVAIGKFEGIIRVYVKAIEDLQEREDISSVAASQQKAVVDQMEGILLNWENVRRSLKNVKAQVEIAMQWEELWNVVLGDIGLEIENLSRLVFEMEEGRHKALLSDPEPDNSHGYLDMQELDTIVEESEKETISHRISLAAASLLTPKSPNSPVSPGIGISPDDTRLLALFSRMQPLRASLDFLPMTLANFQSRAENILPTACMELESRRKTLEKKWKTLEDDAEGLRQELGEDRWIVVFRNAGRQALKLCESVERAIDKLQESIDVGYQHSNPPLLTKKVEAYEAKKSHCGPAIEKIIAIIGKGVTDRVTVNGEIIRLHSDAKARWESIKVEMKDMDVALTDLNRHKIQQLRDSVSTLVSVDRSGTSIGSAFNTPGSSPASSVAVGPTNGLKRDPSPGIYTSSRRSSLGYNNAARPNAPRNFTMPAGSAGYAGSVQIPRKTPVSRSFSSDRGSRGASPSPYAKQSSGTATPGARRPSLQVDNKPRWNSSPKVDFFEFGSKPRPLPFSTPASGRRSSMAFRSPTSAGSHSSGLPLPSPLGRSSPATAMTSATINTRPRMSSAAQSSSTMRQSSFSSPVQSSDWVKIKEKTPQSAGASKRQSLGLDSPASPNTPSDRARTQRPSTSLANGRRISMLPLPKYSASPVSNGTSAPGRQTSLGYRSTTASNLKENLPLRHI